jgi:hypothetical protein
MNKKLIDDQISQLTQILNPYFYNFGFTPNMLTGLSFISMLLSVFMFYKDYRNLAVIFYILNYYFDCADGNMARKYNMVSKFGDFFDHFTDILGVILLILVLYFKNKKTFIKLIPLGIILLFIIFNDLGCEEIKKHKNNEFKSKTLSYTRHFCFISSPNFVYVFNNSFVIICVCLVLYFYK